MEPRHCLIEEKEFLVSEKKILLNGSNNTTIEVISIKPIPLALTLERASTFQDVLPLP
jgi:hypothetical protein